MFSWKQTFWVLYKALKDTDFLALGIFIEFLSLVVCELRSAQTMAEKSGLDTNPDSYGNDVSIKHGDPRAMWIHAVASLVLNLHQIFCLCSKK